MNFGAKEREQRVLCLFGQQGIKFQTSTASLDVYAFGLGCKGSVGERSNLIRIRIRSKFCQNLRKFVGIQQKF